MSLDNRSLAEELAGMPEAEREAMFADMTEAELERLEFDWHFWGRKNQLAPPGDWITLIWLAGRGFGKTRCGVEWIRTKVEGRTPLSKPDFNWARRIAMVAETAADARDVMVEGESGILASSPKDFRPLYEPSKRRLTWPNGAVATLYNAVEPDQLRGPQHDAAWCDELCKWRYAQEAWDQLQFGLRLGDNPQQVVTTTPRPIKLLRDIMETPGTLTIRGSTYDNRSNLAPAFFTKVVAKYEGTRLGRQELAAEVLDDVPGALFQLAQIDGTRITGKRAEDILAEGGDFFRRIVVSMDPAATSGEEANEHGLTVVGLGHDDHGYVLEDLTTQGTPEEIVAIGVKAYHRWKADRFIAEANNGGEWIGTVVKLVDPTVAYSTVHASRGKATRAEPVSALYAQSRIHHVGAFPALEDQMCAFTPSFDAKMAGFSPDRMDALVWGFTELMLNGDDGYTTPEAQILCDPFPIPTFWPRAFALEISGARTFGLFGAKDTATDTIYVYTEHVRDLTEPALHAAAIKARGAWIPGVTIAATRGRTEEDGAQLIQMYREHGLALIAADKAGETGFAQVFDRFSTGRLKVFSTCQNLRREYRSYRRDADGKLVSEFDHGMVCLRTLIQSGQRIMTVEKSTTGRGSRGGGDKTVGY